MVLRRNRKTCISVQQMFRSIRRLCRKMIISSQIKFSLFKFCNSFPSLIFGHCDLTFETPIIDSRHGDILITRFLMYGMLTALLERCILCIIYFPALKIFMFLLEFKSRTFDLEKVQKATKLTTLPETL